MTAAEARTRVRNLLDQTSTTNTQFSESDFIDHALNSGRRYFASILPERLIPALRSSGSLTVAAGVGAYPSDFLRVVQDPYVTIDTVEARRIPEDERWRLRHLEDNTYVASSATEKYFYEYESGVKLFPSTATACVYEYIMVPPDLDTTDRTELPEDIHDLVVDFAFEKCMGTRRGDMELAAFLLRKRESILGSMRV